MSGIDVSTLRAELYRAVDDALARALGENQLRGIEAAPQAGELTRMKVSAYARSRGYAARTVSRYCQLGMPSVGRGKARRVLVHEADQWIASGGAAAAAKAEGGKAHANAQRVTQ
jgi:hypothetical protein